jgi:hypothetical protein
MTSQTKPQHTPGPWVLDSMGYICWQRMDTFTRSEGGIAKLMRPSNEADGRLIAAAPDMLEALQYLIQDRPGTESFDKWWEIRVQAARAAIAKAVGTNRDQATGNGQNPA